MADVAAHAQWSAGRRVLIGCAAGVGRSGLLTALVLMLDGLEPPRRSDSVDWLGVGAAAALDAPEQRAARVSDLPRIVGPKGGNTCISTHTWTSTSSPLTATTR